MEDHRHYTRPIMRNSIPENSGLLSTMMQEMQMPRSMPETASPLRSTMQGLQHYPTMQMPRSIPENSNIVRPMQDHQNYTIEIMPNSIPENAFFAPLQPPRHPVYPRYATLDNRLKSFENWPSQIKLKPEQLAAAGFFSWGEDDRAVCFYCGGGLQNWEDDDDPWEQHAEWFWRCKFLCVQKGEQFVAAIRRKKSNSSLPIGINAVLLERDVPTTSQAAEGTTDPESRLRAVRDEVQTDEEVLLTSMSGMNIEVKTTSSSGVTLTTTKEQVNKQNNVQTDHPILCKICYVNEVALLFVPCGHILACADCGFAFRNCPLCRAQIQNVMKAYIVL